MQLISVYIHLCTCTHFLISRILIVSFSTYRVQQLVCDNFQSPWSIYMYIHVHVHCMHMHCLYRGVVYSSFLLQCTHCGNVLRCCPLRQLGRMCSPNFKEELTWCYQGLSCPNQRYQSWREWRKDSSVPSLWRETGTCIWLLAIFREDICP